MRALVNAVKSNTSADSPSFPSALRCCPSDMSKKPSNGKATTYTTLRSINLTFRITFNKPINIGQRKKTDKPTFQNRAIHRDMNMPKPLGPPRQNPSRPGYLELDTHIDIIGVAPDNVVLPPRGPSHLREGPFGFRRAESFIQNRAAIVRKTNWNKNTRSGPAIYRKPLRQIWLRLN